MSVRRGLVAAAVAALVAGGGLLVAGCPPPGVLPGCGKDTDCKGARICIAHACVDPAPRPVATRPAPLDGGVADAAPPELAPDGGPPDEGVATAPVDLGPPPILALGASPVFHADPAHTGRSRYKAPATPPNEVARVVTGGVVFSSPAIGKDVVVFGSHDRAIYAASFDGKVRWRRPTGDLVWASPALGPGGVVYAGSDDDQLYALDLASGDVRWTFRAGPCRTAVGSGPEAARCDVDGVNVGADGTVFFVADGLYALTPDGKLRWKFSPGARVHCAAAPALSPDGATVYAGCQDDALYAVDAATGVKRWEVRTQGDFDAAPAVGADGTIYAGGDDRKLYAISPSGVVRWAVLTGGAIRGGPALGADGTVFVGAGDGTLYAVRPNGMVAWTFRAADRIVSAPLVDAAGTVLFGSEDDRLYALGPDGKLLWSLLLDGDVDCTPALAADGTIWVGADDKALHGLR